MPAATSARSRGARSRDKPAEHASSDSDAAGAAAAQQALLLQEYSLLKKQVAAKSYEAALQQGWDFLQRVHAARPAAGDSSCLQQLSTAARLNVVLCTAEVQPVQLERLPSLCAVIRGALFDLRRGCDAKTDKQHATLLSRCLLKITLAVAQQAVAADQLPALTPHLQELLAALVAAVQLGGQPGLPQQVACKAFEQLPASLQHCMVVALVDAARAGSSSGSSSSGNKQSSNICSAAELDAAAMSSSSTPLLQASLALQCLQHLAQHTELSAACTSACVSALLQSKQRTAADAPLQATECLLIATLCSGVNTQLPDRATGTLLSAISDCVQLLQQACPTTKSSSGSSSTCGSVKVQAAVTAACAEGQDVCSDAVDAQLSMLRLQAWACNRICNTWPELLAAACPLIIASAACTATTAMRIAQGAEQHQVAALTQAVGSFLAAAADCLACWPRQQSSKIIVSAGPVAVALPLLQQLHWAVELFVSWPALQQHCAEAGHQQEPCSVNGAHDASTARWLAQRLQAAAHAACGKQVTEGGTSFRLNNHVAAGLWLLAVECSCVAAACHSGLLASSAGATGATCAATVSSHARDSTAHPQGSPQLPPGCPVEAAAFMLEGARTYFSFASSCSSPAAAAAATTAMHAPAELSTNPRVLQSGRAVMQVAMRVVLQLRGAEQLALQSKWQSTLRGYSRLRCVAQAAAAGRNSQAGPHGPILQASGRTATQSQHDSMHADLQQPAVPSALQLVTAAGAPAAVPLAGLVRLYWLEGAALSQLAASAGPKEPASASAAVQLLEVHATAGLAVCSTTDRLQLAEALLVHGMLLLQLPDDMHAQDTTGAGNLQQEAMSCLTRACELFGPELGVQCQLSQHGTPSSSSASTSSSTSHGRHSKQQATCSSSSSGGKVKQDSTRRGASGRRQRAQPEQQLQHQAQQSSSCDPADPGAAMQPHSADADSLAAAALCHCLLGLLHSQAAQAMGACLGQGKAQALPLQSRGQSAAAAAGEGGTEQPDDSFERLQQQVAEAWGVALQLLQHSSTLFAASLAAVCLEPRSQVIAGIKSCGAGSQGMLWYGEEVATAVTAAWHVAGFHDWASCQHAFTSVLQGLLESGVQGPRQQLSTCLSLLCTQGSTAAPASSWLWLLMQQQASINALPAADGSPAGSSSACCDEADCQPLPGCYCQLCSHSQQLLALGREFHCCGHSSGWQKLQHLQLQLAAAASAKCCGDSAVAAAVVEHATHHCRMLLGAALNPQQTAQPAAGNSSSSGGSRILAVAQCSLQWHTLGLYMSALLQFAEVQAAVGNPQDAVRVLKELHKLSCSAGCFSFAALAQATLSHVYCGLSEAAKAAAAAATAQRMQQLAVELHQQLPEGANACQQSYTQASIAAAVGSAQAAVALQEQQNAEAQRQLRVGLAALQCCVSSAEAGTAVWRLVDQQAQMHMQLAQVHQQLGESKAALEQLEAAAAALTDAGGGQGCGRCCCGPWPTTWAAIQLRILALDSATSDAAADSAAGGLQLAGFRRGCHRNDLLEEFSKAAGAAEHSSAPQASAAASSIASSSNSSSSSAGQSRGRASRAASSATGRGARSSKAACKPIRTAMPAADQHALGPAEPPHSSSCSKDPAQRLCRVLQVLPLVAQQPLVLKQACTLLVDALFAAGAAEATVMFQHLALGTSLTQQQLVLATSKLLQAQQLAAGAGGEAPAAADEPQQVWTTVQALTSYTGVLQHVASVARDALDHGPEDPSARLQQLVKAVDAAAHTWLLAALQHLPEGAAVCGLSCKRDAGAAGGKEHLLLSRVHSTAAGGQASCLLVQLPGPTSTRGPLQAGVAGVLEQLQSLLSDASASMAAASTSDKGASHNAAKWWQQRLELDSRMSSLLQELDQQWLGPWRCLLLQPASAAEEEAALQASLSIVSEHFDCVLDDKSKHLLSQLLARLVVNNHLCSAAELASALQDLGTMVQQRMDGWHLQQLLQDMQAAQRTSAAADAASPTARHAEAGTDAGSACGVEAVSVSVQTSSRARSSRTRSKLPESPKACVGPSATPAPSRMRSSARPSAVAQQLPSSSVSAMPQTSSKTAAGCNAGPVLVPPSIARHAQRRSRLKALNSGAGRLSEAAVPEVPEGEATCCSDQGCGEGGGAQGKGDPVSSSVGTQSADLQPRRSRQVPPGATPQHKQRQHEQRAQSVILVMDDCVQQLPWESCKGLQASNMYRCPSLAFASALAAKTVASRAGVPPQLHLTHSYYLLNPDGDLTGTQDTFERQLQQLCAKGLAGKCPAPGQLLSALHCHDVYLYFGHGAGEQYLPLPSLRKLDSCAASLLMGCSSGRLKLSGGFEAHGPVWAYLTAGCPAVVANLWDVTDRDIDRFAARLLQQWSTQAGADGSGGAAEQTTLSASVSLCRLACRLPALIGAAPVCYGLPAALDAAAQQDQEQGG